MLLTNAIIIGEHNAVFRVTAVRTCMIGALLSCGDSLHIRLWLWYIAIPIE